MGLAPLRSSSSAASTCWSTTPAARAWAPWRNWTKPAGATPSSSISSRRSGSPAYAPPQMENRGGGSIINISSIYGREAGGPLTYNTSKAAMISFTKVLARELAPKAVRVNSIAPGSIIYPGGTGKALQGQSGIRKRFHQPRISGRTPRPSRRSGLRGRDAGVAPRELDHRHLHSGRRRPRPLEYLSGCRQC